MQHLLALSVLQLMVCFACSTYLRFQFCSWWFAPHAAPTCAFSSAADGLLRMQHLLARGGAHTNTEPRYIQPCCTHFNFTLLSNKPIYSLVIAFWEINYCWVLYNWKWKRNRAWSGVLPLLFARGNKKFSGLKLSMQYVLVLLANMAWEAR